MRSARLFLDIVAFTALATSALMAGCSHSDPEYVDRILCTTSSGGCDCEKTLGPPQENGLTCDASSFPGTICCAETGWPSYGGCSCSKPTSGCDESADGSCTCGDEVSGDAKRCTPPSGGICCQTTGESQCQCRTKTTKCNSGETAVTACTAPPATCSKGSRGTKVTSCESASSSGSSSTSSSSSSSSSGSSGSTCEPNTDTCSSDSDCKCGATCFATCASCDTYCGVECTSMSDCEAFRPGYFSECHLNTSGEGRCVQ